MNTHTITYKEGSDEFEGFVAVDEQVRSTGAASGKPCIVVCHAWGGQGDFEREKAKSLAGLGYVGFAMDVYGKGKRGTNPEENTKLMKPLAEDRALLHRRLEAGLNAARNLPGVDKTRIGAIGFCFGGLCALDIARHGSAGLKGVVSFHGIFSAPPADVVKPVKKIDAKILALHGFDDPMGKPDQVLAFAKEMTDAHADWQIHMYGHTKHGFTNPAATTQQLIGMGIQYEANANRRSWIEMKDFLEEVFV